MIIPYIMENKKCLKPPIRKPLGIYLFPTELNNNIFFNHQPAVYGNDGIKNDNDQHQCWMLIRWRLFHLAYGIVMC